MAAAAARCGKAFAISHATILSSSTAAEPFTLGARRPVIILPAHLFESASEETLAAILGHEMAHIRRHDFLLNLIYELIYLPISFHPAAALMKHRIDGARELACDEMVIERLLDANSYARTLVDLARSIATFSRPHYTLGVFDADILEERIMRLMNQTAPLDKRRGRLLFLAASLLPALSCITASAFSVKIAQDEKSQQETAAQSAARAIVGDWKLSATVDGR